MGHFETVYPSADEFNSPEELEAERRIDEMLSGGAVSLAKTDTSEMPAPTDDVYGWPEDTPSADWEGFPKGEWGEAPE